MQLEIADAILREAHLTAADIKLELAVLLWQRGGLSEAGAALLAGQALPEFYAELRRRELLPAQPVRGLKGMVPPLAQTVSLEQPAKKYLAQTWAGGLREYAGQYNSMALQKQALEWRCGHVSD